ncbi:MAG: YbaK/EbsC family protein [Bacilli bacterium]
MENILLDFKPVIDNKDLVSSSVLEAILDLNNKEDILVAEIDQNYAGGLELCERYKVDPKYGANCLIVEAKRSDAKTYAALLVPVGYKYNMSTVVRKQLNARMVSVAPLNFVLENTKMEYGSITPIGIPTDWLIFIDPLVLKQDKIIIGSGLKKSKLMIPSFILLKLPNAIILEGLAKEGNE